MKLVGLGWSWLVSKHSEVGSVERREAGEEEGWQGGSWERGTREEGNGQATGEFGKGHVENTFRLRWLEGRLSVR